MKKRKKEKEIISLANVVDILSEYSLYHVPIFDGEHSGMIHPEFKCIVIDDSSRMFERKMAVIHELIHGKDLMEIGASDEDKMKERTLKAFSQIFGVKQYEKRKKTNGRNE
jgi:monoamine oxidase